MTTKQALYLKMAMVNRDQERGAKTPRPLNSDCSITPHPRCTVGHAETECAAQLVGWPAYAAR